jgi:hypothetical protein
MEIDGVTHVREWRSRDYIVYQNYSDQRLTSSQPMLDQTPQVVGTNFFHVYEIIQHNPGEELGAEVATYADLQSSMDFIAKQEAFA